MKIIQCRNCGADIRITDKHQGRKMFCSVKCVNLSRKKHNREIICKRCGKTVIQSVNKGLFCNECILAKAQERRKGLTFVEKKKEKKICECCGKTFIPKVINSVYCSKECQNAINKGTLKCSICDKAIKDDIFYHNITDFSPICLKCKDIYANRNNKKWDSYEAWHKLNPDKSYGDYQTMQRIEKGEIVCQQ